MVAHRISTLPNPSQAKASLARLCLIGQLRRESSEATDALAAILETCTDARPCRSAACPVCGRAFQLAAVSVVDRFIREPARGLRGRMHALTIVLDTGCLAPNALSAEAWKRTADEIEAVIKVLGLPPVIVSIEASFNEDTTGKIPPHWCIHVHIIGIDWLSQSQRNGLSAAFQSSKWAKRPTYYEQLDQDIRGRLYPFKAERIRRVTQLITDDPHRKPYRKSKRRDLRPWQAVNLALIEHQVGFGGRLLTHEIDADAVKRHFEALGWPRDGPGG